MTADRSGAAGVHVRTSDLVVRIGAVRVLDDVSVEIERATLTAVVGPSGSGKTTLLNVLARLQAPSSGSVYYDGIAGRPAATRIGLVHQAFALLSLLTAAENVELAAQLRGLPPAEVHAAAERCLAAVDLRDRADHLVEELSGGEQQRVAVARALVSEPHLLLADEPTAHLDQRNRDHLVERLHQLAGAGTTVVIATHDPDVAAGCDAVIELRAGRVGGA